MRLVHFSERHVPFIRDAEQPSELLLLGCYTKPIGFWVSDEDEYGWKTWCESEQFGLDRFSHVHDVRLKENHNILHLKSGEDIDAFTEEYKSDLSDIYGKELALCGINWQAVSAKYNGLLITPYIWERRHDLKSNWYYGWDCASACIWRASEAVEEIVLRSGGDVDGVPLIEVSDQISGGI